jgi:NAD(P)-dependent dehydrogenase (short-subunit alcohol dehydrogenase family)
VSDLRGLVALVTGASRGVGRGIASELSRAGATVYASGRTIQHAHLPDEVVRVQCDHTDDFAVGRLFEQLRGEQSRLDLLVNSSWGGYERMIDDEGKLTWLLPFWEQPRWRWDAMMEAGVRASFIASQESARIMIAQRRGLIVNLSYWAAQKYMSNVLYGVAKAATDKLSFDMALDLRPYKVAVVSLYPGLVRTEAVLAAGMFDLRNSESPEFVGRAVAALAGDRNVFTKSGQVHVAAALAWEYGFTDLDGTRPVPLRLQDV